MRMKPQIKAAFVQLLRSGRFKQMRNYLKGEINGEVCYCAVGLLCEMYSRANNTKWEKHSNGLFSLDGSICSLPTKVRVWAGISDCTVIELAYNGKYCSIDYLNDTFYLSFKQIANLVEEQL